MFRYFLILLAFAVTHAGADSHSDSQGKADLTDKSEKWDVNDPPITGTSAEATIDVDSGTWMSLDVSPDGQELVFDLLGNIYRLPIQGGEAQALTSGLAWDMQPRYSPDGKMIAFTSDRGGGDNIWTMDLESKEMSQISHESFRLLNNPTWSPDGNYIAARKHFTTSRSLGTGEIWLYHVNGGKGATGVQVVERPDPTYQKELGEPMFSPDGRSIYYTQAATSGNTFIYRDDSNGELFRIKQVDLATGGITDVAGGAGGAVRPTPSPDGSTLAYVKRVRAKPRLFVKDLASGVDRMLDDSLDPDMQETWAVHGVYPNMDWTPDGEGIVYWSQGKIWLVDVDSGKKTNIPFRVRDSRRLLAPPKVDVAVAPDVFLTKMVRFASRSPDGESVVFESLGRLYVKRGDDEPELLTRNAGGAFELSPVYSPDGRFIYFLRWSDEELGSVHRVSARGDRARAVTSVPGHYGELAISPDGEQLVLRKSGGNSLRSPFYGKDPGIYLIDIDSGELSFVAEQGGSPHFGPDGRIYFNQRSSSSTGRGSDTGTTQLRSMTLSGHDVRVHAESALARRIVLSPDGGHVAFREGYHIYLSALPPTGQVVSLGPDQKNVPAKRVSTVGGEFLSFSPDGGSISWSLGPELKTVSVQSALFSEDFETATVNMSMAVQADKPEGRVALTNATIVTMNSARSVINNGVILIEGNRIVAVGESGDVSIPDDAALVDLEGKTVIPGMIDAHAHGPHGSGDVIPQKNWDSLAHLALGVTTMHNPSSRASLVFASSEYQRAGKILTPRLYSTGEIVYGAKGRSFAPVDSLENALAYIKRLKAQGAHSVKNYNQPRRDQRQQVNEAARQAGLMVVSEGGSLYHMDMNLIADGTNGVEHNIPTMKIYDDVLQFWRQSEVGYTPTLAVTFGGLTSEDYFYQETEVWKHPILSHFVPPTVLQPRAVRRTMAPEQDFRDDDAAAVAKSLMEAGVTVNTGAHGQREGLATHWEMWSFVRGGMSPMQAIAAATIMPANYLGFDSDLGSIEAGKLADLAIIDGDPLANIRQSDKVTHVMLNGRLYEAATLNEVVTGDQMLKPLWWHDMPHMNIK